MNGKRPIEQICMRCKVHTYNKSDEVISILLTLKEC